MLFEQGSLVGVGHPALFEATPDALPVAILTPVMGALVPVPVAARGFTARIRGARRLALGVHHGTAKVVLATLESELGVLLRVLEGIATLALVGEVVAGPGVVVGVVHADGGARGRLLHRQ
jgi:hypothetical protein